MSPNAKMMLGIFLPLYAIHCMEQIYFVFGNVLQQYALSPQAIGWILSVFFVAIMAMRPMGSWMLENLGIRKTLITGSILGFVGCTILFFAKGIPMLILGRILSGASFGIYTIGLFSYQGLTVPEEMRGGSFAIIVSGGVLPTATVTPIGELLLMRGHTKLFLALGPLLCIVCYILGKRVGASTITPSKEPPAAWGRYRDLVSFRGFRMLALTGTMIALVDASIVSMSLLAAEKKLLVSYFLASSSLFAVILRVVGSRFLNTLPRSLIFAPCGILMSAALFAISVIPSNTTFLIAGSLFGIGIGGAFPTFLALISDTLPYALRPKGTAFALLLYDSGWFLTPLIVGYTSYLLGISWTFRVISIVSFTALCLLQIFYWVPLFRAKRERIAGERANTVV